MLRHFELLSCMWRECGLILGLSGFCRASEMRRCGWLTREYR